MAIGNRVPDGHNVIPTQYFHPEASFHRNPDLKGQAVQVPLGQATVIHSDQFGGYHYKHSNTADESTSMLPGDLMAADSNFKYKVCPECAGLNQPSRDWCMLCGGVLIGVDPIQGTECKGEIDRVRLWRKRDEEIQTRNDAEESLARNELGSGSFVFTGAEENGSDHMFDDNPNHDKNERNSGEDFDFYVEEEEYKHQGFGKETMEGDCAILTPIAPEDLKLDLPASTRSTPRTSGASGMLKHNKSSLAGGDNLGEDLAFVYDNPQQKDSPKLSPDLKAELSLDLGNRGDGVHHDSNPVNADNSELNRAISNARRKCEKSERPSCRDNGDHGNAPVIKAGSKISIGVSTDERDPEPSVGPPRTQGHHGDTGRLQTDQIKTVGDNRVQVLHSLPVRPPQASSEPTQSRSVKPRPHSASSGSQPRSSLRASRLVQSQAQPRWATSSPLWSSSVKQQRPRSAYALPSRASIQHSRDDSAVLGSRDESAATRRKNRPASAGPRLRYVTVLYAIQWSMYRRPSITVY